MAKADVSILAALIEQHAVGQDPICRSMIYRATSKSALEAANAILAAGFKMRDTALEDRVEKLERWTRGEF